MHPFRDVFRTFVRSLKVRRVDKRQKMFETRQPEIRDLFGWEFAENEDDWFMTPTRAAPRPPPAAMTAEYVVSQTCCNL